MASGSGITRLLVLTALADEEVDGYDLVGFRGREALSEPFLYHLDIRTPELPASLGNFVGKLVEWTLTWMEGEPRTFAGRIYEARLVAGAEALPIVQLVVRPAYWAASYARGTHFTQDQSSIEIFDAVTAKVPGLVTDKQASAEKRAYAVRYDESELDFLDRLLAQDGIFYYFTYDQGGGAYHHKMKLANAAAGYADVPGDVTVSYMAGVESSEALDVGYDVAAATRERRSHGFEVNKLDTPFRAYGPVTTSWASVYEHGSDELAGNASTAKQVAARNKSSTSAVEQAIEVMSGSSVNPAFFAGGRISFTWSEGGTPQKLVLTSVEHEASDDSRQGGLGIYRNRWTAIDAALTFSPPVPVGRRRAYGPMLGVIKNQGGAEGEVVVDGQSRVPVTISQAIEGDADKPFDPFVWLPVAQQWAASTHGAQFFPRIGARVMVDFLYGDPDLPFVAGSFYTPSAAYPFDPASNATQTGWRSKTNKNGSIKQEFLFEDKPGGEEIYLYTGRNYRRQVDKDELGTIDNDRTILVKNNHSETVTHDQTIKIGDNQTQEIGKDQKETVTGAQTMEVKKDRKHTVGGAEDVDVTGARTVKVKQKNTLESLQEIEIKVGPSSIKLGPDGITIKAPIVTVQGDGMVEVKSPMTQVKGDGMLMLKGGIVMIN